MRAPWVFVLLAMVACAPEEPPATLLVAAPQGPSNQQALYPADEPVLAKCEGARFLPSDTPLLVTVIDLPSLLHAAGMARTFERGGEPYDQALAALTSWAAGVTLDDVAALAGAGIDGGAVWSAAWFEVAPRDTAKPPLFGAGFDARVVFGPVSDEAQLRARLEASAKERKRALIVEPLAAGTLYRTKEDKPDSVLLVREGVAYFIRSIETGDATARDLAKTIASVAPEESLREAPAFRAHLAALAFGPHAAAFMQPQVVLRRAVAAIAHDQDNLRKSFDQLKELVAHREKEPERDEEALDRYRRRLGARDHELVFADKRAAALTQLADGLTGISVGLEVGLTALRAKAHVGFADGASPLRASAEPLAAMLAGSDAPLGGLQIEVDPTYLRELMVLASSETSARRVETQLRAAGIDVDAELTELFDGRVALARAAGEGGWVMSLGVKDAARARAVLKTWADGEDAKTLREAEEVVVGEASLSLRSGPEAKPHVALAIVGDRILVASGDEALASAQAAVDPAKWWLTRAADPLIARLADVRADGFFVVESRYADGLTFPEVFRLRRGSRRVFAQLDSFVFSDAFSFGRSDSDRAKKLRKKRDAIRADIATLQGRQDIARRTGSGRLMTALGSSVAFMDARADGVTIHAGQMIGENDLAALGEWAVWSVVDSSDASPTARELAKLQKRLEAVQDQLEEENQNAPSVFGVMGRIGDMGVMSTANVFGPADFSHLEGVGVGGLGTPGSAGGSGRGSGSWSGGSIRNQSGDPAKSQAGTGASD